MLGEDQHRHAGRLANDAAKQFQPRQAGQVEIQNDQRESSDPDCFQRRLAGGGFRHLDIAALVEQSPDAGAHDGVIFHHQNRFHATIRSWAMGRIPTTRTPPLD